MSYSRIALAALAGTVAYFVLGGLVFGLSPLTNEFRKYPAVYRPADQIKRVMPLGMVAMLLSIAALAVLYAMLYRGGSGLADGARFGALIAVYSVGSFVIHNHVNLNIGGRLTTGQAIAYLVQWTVVGVVIGLVYRPA